MNAQVNTPPMKLCKGPLHSEGKLLRLDSFASERSPYCRICQRDYDQRRGSLRGPSRASMKESKNNKPQQNIITMPPKNAELELKGKGVERVSIAEIDNLVDDYVKKRDSRMAHTEKEVAAKVKLIDALWSNKAKIGVKTENGEEVLVYRHDDLIVTLKHGKDDLKVRTNAAEDDE